MTITTKAKKQALKQPVITDINPNIPQQLTEEEWTEYLSSLEKGNFRELEVANFNFSVWKKKLLAEKL